jgi:hypothetical protein
MSCASQRISKTISQHTKNYSKNERSVTNKNRYRPAKDSTGSSSAGARTKIGVHAAQTVQQIKPDGIIGHCRVEPLIEVEGRHYRTLDNLLLAKALPTERKIYLRFTVSHAGIGSNIVHYTECLLVGNRTAFSDLKS